MRLANVPMVVSFALFVGSAFAMPETMQPTQTVRGPQRDSNGNANAGPNDPEKVEKLKFLATSWNKMPVWLREAVLADITHDMPPRYREAIRTYLEKLQR